MGKLTFASFVLGQWTALPTLTPADLTGRIVLIVGGGSGLGLEAAKHIAHMKPKKLLLTTRSVKNGEDVVSGSSNTFTFCFLPVTYCTEIRSETGLKAIVSHTVDLSVLTSVQALAELLERTEDQIDVLVYNAGVAMAHDVRTTDGWETKYISILLLW